MFGSVNGREFVIVFVIAMIALAGSRVPRLVRSFTEARHARESPPTNEDLTPNEVR